MHEYDVPFGPKNLEFERKRKAGGRLGNIQGLEGGVHTRNGRQVRKPPFTLRPIRRKIAVMNLKPYERQEIKMG